MITTENGLLYEDGALIPLPKADLVARQHGYPYAEQMVKDLEGAFKWRTSKGEFREPKDLATSHLYNILKMVWNHAAPEESKIRPYRKYNFGAFYTSEYMRKAVIAVAKELLKRKDLSDKMVDGLERIEKAIRNEKITGG